MHVCWKKFKRTYEMPESLISQAFHFVSFKLKKPKMQFENGMFIISVDVDVGNKMLGLINKGKNDADISKYYGEYGVGRMEEIALPLFISLFNEFEVPATFALRGQLIDVGATCIDLLLDSPVKHDIGAHGYSHKRFKRISYSEAERELSMISTAMKKIRIIPKTFIFPGNSVAYLDLLEKYGYKCYRGYDDLTSQCMNIEKQGQLYNVHASLSLDKSINSFFTKRILDIAISRKLPFHAWFHAWEFGETKGQIQKRIAKVFFPLVNYAKNLEENGVLTFETMFSAARKLEKFSGDKYA